MFKLVRDNFIPSTTLALLFQGLTLYFCITGIINFKPEWLTGVYIIALLSLTFIFQITNRKAWAIIRDLGVADILFIFFFTLLIFDIFTGHYKFLPNYLLIYLLISILGYFSAKGLSFSQLKKLFFSTFVVNYVASFILILQLITGTANYLGGRLVAGLGDNPILTGYSGSMTALMGLILLLQRKVDTPPYWNISALLLGTAINIVSGTRSSTLFLVSSCIAIFWIRFFTFRSKFRSNHLKSKVLSIRNWIVSIFALLLTIYLFSSSTAITRISSVFETVYPTLNNTWLRISQLLLLSTGQESDLSFAVRKDLYSDAFRAFTENPIYGSGLYSIKGSSHNAVLQVLSDLGLLGLITFIVPIIVILAGFIHAVKDYKSRLIHDLPKHSLFSDTFPLIAFAIVLIFEIVCLWGFHGDPYFGGMIPFVSLGVVIAITRNLT